MSYSYWRKLKEETLIRVLEGMPGHREHRKSTESYITCKTEEWLTVMEQRRLEPTRSSCFFLWLQKSWLFVGKLTLPSALDPILLTIQGHGPSNFLSSFQRDFYSLLGTFFSLHTHCNFFHHAKQALSWPHFTVQGTFYSHLHQNSLKVLQAPFFNASL